MRLKEYDQYSIFYRNCLIQGLGRYITKGVKEQIAALEKQSKKHCENIVDIQKERDNIEKMSMASKEVLENPELLEQYLTLNVQRDISSILTALECSPSRLSLSRYGEHYRETLERLEAEGLEDATAYFGQFTSIEEVREDLYKKAGLDYVPFEEIFAAKIKKDQASDSDFTSIMHYQDLCEKAGIVPSNWTYDCSLVDPVTLLEGKNHGFTTYTSRQLKR